MEFYIMPDQRQKCERKLELMFKHWDNKPSVEYSEVQQVVKTTTVVYQGGMADENGYERYREKFDAIKWLTRNYSRKCHPSLGWDIPSATIVVELIHEE